MRTLLLGLGLLICSQAFADEDTIKMGPVAIQGLLHYSTGAKTPTRQPSGYFVEANIKDTGTVQLPIWGTGQRGESLEKYVGHRVVVECQPKWIPSPWRHHRGAVNHGPDPMLVYEIVTIKEVEKPINKSNLKLKLKIIEVKGKPAFQVTLTNNRVTPVELEGYHGHDYWFTLKAHAKDERYIRELIEPREGKNRGKITIKPREKQTRVLLFELIFTTDENSLDWSWSHPLHEILRSKEMPDSPFHEYGTNKELPSAEFWVEIIVDQQRITSDRIRLDKTLKAIK